MDVEAPLPHAHGGLSRVPAWTLGICAAALLVYFSPGFPDVLVFERAAIEGGEYWRLVTGHWVHFTTPHLLYNLVVLGIAGAVIETRGYGSLGLLVLLAAALVGAVLFLAEPGMTRYGGLSGIATAAVTYLALHGINDPPPWRYVAVAILIGLVVKFAAEFGAGQSLMPGVEHARFRTVPLSHAAGALAAALAFFLSLWREYRRKPDRG